METQITKEEAELYIHLLLFAFAEGQGIKEAYELGRILRDKYFPGEYADVFDERRGST